MKQIPLTQGQVAMVDDGDYDALMKHRWKAQWDRKGLKFYAATSLPFVNGKSPYMSMHRMILGLTDRNIQGDHINGKTLDNQRGNLRAVTRQQNQMNRQGANRCSRTGARGVFQTKCGYKVQIRVNGKALYVGLFPTITQAAAAYDAANRKHYGEFGGCKGD